MGVASSSESLVSIANRSFARFDTTDLIGASPVSELDGEDLRASVIGENIDRFSCSDGNRFGVCEEAWACG